MSASPSLSSGFASLPASPWQDTTPATVPTALQNNRNWFAQPAPSARVFSVQAPALSNTDVDAWANQPVGHLLESFGATG